jgi:aerobic carbon-monoxide dehydrogenase medium subunit
MDSFDQAPPPLVGLRGRQRIAPFTLARPDSIGDALALRQTPRSAWMAGGVDLIDGLKHGTRLDRIIPLGGLGELGAVERSGNGSVRIGALTTYQQLADDATVREVAPALAALIGAVANFRIRSKATVGGSIMSGNGMYDLMPALLASGAKLIFAGTGGEERQPAARLGQGETRLLTAVELPAATVLRADRSLRPAVCVYVGATFRENAVAEIRAATSCAHARPAVAAVDAGSGSLRDTDFLTERLAAGLPDPVGDGVASSSYRARMIRVLIRRLLETPFAEPQP